MTQNEIDLHWSELVAEDIADELIAGKILAKSDLEFAVRIAAQMIHIHLVSGDRPEASNNRYRDQT